jgi:hypothetical protein
MQACLPTHCAAQMQGYIRIMLQLQACGVTDIVTVTNETERLLMNSRTGKQAVIHALEYTSCANPARIIQCL